MNSPGKGPDDGVLFFVISAPSGAGKTTLCKKILDTVPGLTFSVSHTTRPPRNAEKEGVDYYFVDEAAFDRMVRENMFLEWANVYGRRYGTSKAEIERARRIGNDLLMEIDCQGARQVRRVMPETIGIFIVPPSFETLKERLTKRGTESQAEIEKRLSIAIKELADYKNFQYAIVNDDPEKAAREMECVILAERCRMPRKRAFIEKMFR